ncbi:hypothetical protein SETIT_5G160600v2 [Setaria italica]|uniref:Uncharacterized protein n=1 Tax=Setaria italica TaxID=4555 RepID=A0A368R5K9_SETIT|nr:hypothetical protein SETIT_5G160600v2 [Setaria italica]
MLHTCIRRRRSCDSSLWNRFLVNSCRNLSTSACSLGVPRLGSNTHSSRPRKPFFDCIHGPPPSATFNLHIWLWQSSF